jgi:ribose transport system permease protein
MSKFYNIFKFKEAGIISALIVIASITALLNPLFLSVLNLQLLTRQIAIFGILALGEMFVLITTGVDLSPGSVVAMTCILSAWFMTHGFGILGAIIMIFVISAGTGAMHGVFVSKLRVPPFIITLCTFLIARGIGGAITKGWPVLNIPPAVTFLWRGDFLKVPIPVIILILIIGISIFILRFSTLGRHIYAVGGNIEAARLSGIDVDKTRIIVYTISTTLAGIVGILHTAWLEQGNVSVGQLYELYAIAATVIGGTSLFGGVGTILGTIIGASILSTIWNSMLLLEVSAYWQNVVLGVVIIVAVTVDTLRKRGK